MVFSTAFNGSNNVEFPWKSPRELHLAKLNFRKYSCSRLRGREAWPLTEKIIETRAVAGSGGLVCSSTSGLWESTGKYPINGNQWESWEKNKTKTMEISPRRLHHIANLSWLHVATTAGVPNLWLPSRLISVRHSYKLHTLVQVFNSEQAGYPGHVLKAIPGCVRAVNNQHDHGNPIYQPQRIKLKRLSKGMQREEQRLCYPLVMSKVAIENAPVEIVDFPIKNGGSFHSYVSHYQRVTQVISGNIHLPLARRRPTAKDRLKQIGLANQLCKMMSGIPWSNN